MWNCSRWVRGRMAQDDHQDVNKLVLPHGWGWHINDGTFFLAVTGVSSLWYPDAHFRVRSTKHRNMLRLFSRWKCKVCYSFRGFFFLHLVKKYVYTYIYTSQSSMKSSISLRISCIRGGDVIVGRDIDSVPLCSECPTPFFWKPYFKCTNNSVT